MNARYAVATRSVLGALFLTLLPSTAAFAALEVGTGGLKLVDASGVPDAPKHVYGFEGILTLYPTPENSKDFTSTLAKFWADGTGTWDETTNKAKESFQFQGDIAGTLSSTFQCQKDPWLNKPECVVTGVQYVNTKGTLYDWSAVVHHAGRPISAGAVTLAAATELSKKHAAVPPPPPPPSPAPKQTTPTVSVTPAPGGFTIAAPQVAATPPPRGLTTRAPAGAATVTQGKVLLPRPDLLVTGASAFVESSCNPALPVVKVRLNVKNAGAGPFPALPGNHVISIKADAGLASGGVELGAVAPGQVILRDVPIVASRPPAELAGTSHTLAVQLNTLKWAEESSYANNTSSVKVTFPPTYCKQPARAPAAVRAAPAPGVPPAGQVRGLNPQPEPPSRR